MTDEPVVPEGAEVHGSWQMTPFGRARTLKWDSIYPGLPDGNGEYDKLVRITALQAPTGRVDMFGVEIDVAGSFSTGEAALIAASINAAVSKIAEIQQARGEL